MSDKPKFAMYWAAGCGGCEIALLNTGLRLLDVDANFEIVLWPLAVDAKYADVAALPDGSIALTLFNGGIRNAENAHMAHLLRRKSQWLVAFGACAIDGGIPGLANAGAAAEVLAAAFDGVTTTNPGVRPQAQYATPDVTLTLPALSPTLRTLDQLVAVDYYLPGCPPESAQIAAVLDLVLAALHGAATLPPRGSVIGAGESTVCDECVRARHGAPIGRLRRIHEVAPIDPTLCLLEQGILCCGPATRSGCGALCPAAGAACIGCYGAPPGVADGGARLMAALASPLTADDPRAIDALLDAIVDPVGTFYRFGLARSLLHAGAPALAAQPQEEAAHDAHHD